jgi:hypothetical protein
VKCKKGLFPRNFYTLAYFSHYKGSLSTSVHVSFSSKITFMCVLQPKSSDLVSACALAMIVEGNLRYL